MGMITLVGAGKNSTSPPPPPPPPAPTTLLAHTFTAADASDVAGLTPDTDAANFGGINALNSLTVYSNKASAQDLPDATSAYVVWPVLAASGNCTITVNVTVPDNGNGDNGLVFRCADSANCWKVDIGTFNALRIVEVNAGTATTRDSTAHAFTGDQTYALTVVLSDDSITASCDGATATYSSTFLKGVPFLGGVGRRSDATHYTLLDSLTVTGTLAATLTEDTFTAADGTNGNGRTPSPTTTGGAAWAALSGSWQTTSNALVLSATATERQLVCATGAADVLLLASVTAAAGTFGGLCPRTSTDGNSWQVEAVPTDGKLYLIQQKVTIRASAAAGIAADTAYRVAVACVGDVLIAAANKTMVAYLSASFNDTATKHGVLLNGTAGGAVADNYKAVSLA